MKKLILLACLLCASMAQASLLFSNVSFTSNTVSFTVNGDMSGYTAPTQGANGAAQFSIQYLGDIWQSASTTFLFNNWNRSVFDNEALSTNGYTGTVSRYENSYSWSKYRSSLSDAVVDNAEITLTMSTPRLNINAVNPIIQFLWGGGYNDNHTVLQTVDILKQNAAVPNASSITLVLLGLISFLYIRQRVPVLKQQTASIKR